MCAANGYFNSEIRSSGRLIIIDMDNVKDKKDTVEIKTSDTKIISVLKKNKDNILNDFHIAYCHYISDRHPERKKREIKYLLKVCIPVKNRFSIIFDRFISFLKNGYYDLSLSEKDTIYAMKYVVPAHYKELKSHDVIMMVKSFISIAGNYASAQLANKGYIISNERITSCLNSLVYIIFEDLWVSSVVGFRHQHKVIQKLLASITKTQEETSQKLAEEIHNDVLQLLATVPVKLEIIDELVDKDIKDCRKEIKNIKLLINDIASSLRDLSGELCFFWTERKGLSFSMKNFIRRFERVYKMPIDIVFPKNYKEIKGFPGLMLFRIIQEGLYNVGRHSKAKKAKIVLKKYKKALLITIVDNGIGFDLRKIEERSFLNGNLGLVFMKERIKSLKGDIEINSVMGKGTKIKILIPYNSLTGRLH